MHIEYIHEIHNVNNMANITQSNLQPILPNKHFWGWANVGALSLCQSMMCSGQITLHWKSIESSGLHSAEQNKLFSHPDRAGHYNVQTLWTWITALISSTVQYISPGPKRDQQDTATQWKTKSELLPTKGSRVVCHWQQLCHNQQIRYQLFAQQCMSVWPSGLRR